MSFAVICKSCQARFLLNDDLLRRRVAGRVVTVRCRQCHATIEVDASDLDPKALPEAGPPAPAAPKATTKLMFKSPRPAPTPPRPPAKSTLMGIGAPRPAGATELVALSAGFLSMNETPAAPTAVSAQGFPEPPPPPAVAATAAAAVDVADWDLVTPPPKAPVEAAPESVDDFLEELPPSEPPPIEEELPSSTGTPSLKALAHHDHHDAKPRVDDFIANMSAAMNGGLMPSVPTIDVSHLTAEPVTSSAPSIDMSDFELPEPGAQTLALFAEPALETKAAQVPPKPAPGRPAPPRSATATPAAVGPVASDPPPLELQGRPDAPRERKATASTAEPRPPASVAAPRRSGLAAPLLLALAAAAAFLIWRRGAAPVAEPALQAERPTPNAPAKPAVLVESAPATSPVPEASAAPSAVPDDMTFEVTPAKPEPIAARHTDSSASAPATATATATATAARNEPSAAPAPATEEPKPEAKPEPAGPAEPAGPFDRAAASSALNASAGQASACRKEGDPSGVASVVVTFAPSGRVTSANISGPPFAGTATGGCIASALRRTRIPAFEGDRVTVSKTVVIQ